jgi:hypothetical protein
MNKFIAPYSHSYLPSPAPSLSHGCQYSSLGKAYSALLFSDFVGKER